MQEVKRSWVKAAALALGLVLLMSGPAVRAQERPARLFITGTDAGSLPNIELHAYGIDGEGNALDLAHEAVTVRYNKSNVAAVSRAGAHLAGTFTVFLIDIPTGVVDQLPRIQDSIIQYSSSPTMMEQVDFVAIYQVGTDGATPLLDPDGFYNGVRNLFASPLATESGATALVDSLMGLLDQIEAIKPDPAMASSIVVISDGTDVVSTQFDPEDVALRAEALSIPIHTIWLENADLSPPGKEQGQRYLLDVAAESRGLNASLSNGTELAAIWERIASFREQSRIDFLVDDPAGGTFPIELSLSDDPDTLAETSVQIRGNRPIVDLNLPPESRVLTLPDLDEPVTLRFSPKVSWIDGNERQLTVAQLIVNESSTQSIPVEDFSEFEIDLDNLVFGDNSIQIAVLDEQGLRVTSPQLLLSIMEGPQSLPEELKPQAGLGGIIGRVFLVLFGLAVAAGVTAFVWRQGWFTGGAKLIPRGRSGRVRRRQSAQAGSPVEPGLVEPVESPDRAPIAYLEVLESVSRVQAQFPLTKSRIRIGRSPSQTDIAFENDITVSRIHVSLMLEGNHYRIFDEESTSGTWVNDQQVPEYGIQLMEGDEVHLGAVHLRFRQPQY